MADYKPRYFQGTMQAAIGPNAARIAPVSRFANIFMGEIVDKIVEAQYRVGIPDEETVKKLKAVDFGKEGIKTDKDLLALYERMGVKFQEGTRPLNVIEVCFEPKSPETMRHYFEAACRYRDERESTLPVPLKVFIGTTQTAERFKYMIEHGFLPDAVVSTNMAPLMDPYIRAFCKEYGIVLGPNIGYSSDNLVACLESVEKQDGKPIAGAAIQKTFPFGAINSLDFLKAMTSTHPGAVLMPTGGVSYITVRDLIRYGAELVGASAPSKKEDIVQAAYADVRELKGPAAWEPFIRNASVMATEVHIGLLLRQEDKANAKTSDADLDRKFQEVVGALKGD